MLQVSEKEEISWAATQKAKNFFSSTHARKRETQKSFFAFFSSPSKSVSACPSKKGAGFDQCLSFLSKIYGRRLLGRQWLFIAPFQSRRAIFLYFSEKSFGKSLSCTRGCRFVGQRERVLEGERDMASHPQHNRRKRKAPKEKKVPGWKRVLLARLLPHF